MKLPFYIHHPHAEERGVNTMVCTLAVVIIKCAVFVQHMEIQCLCREVGMQFTHPAVYVRTVVVEDAVSDIARLLHLCKQNPSANGMHPSCRQKEDVSLMHLMPCKGITYRALFNHLPVFRRREAFSEAGIQECAGLGVNDIPHLGLSHLAV